MKHYSAEEHRLRALGVRYGLLALCLLTLAALLSLPHACNHEPASTAYFTSVPGSFMLPGDVFAIPGQPLPLMELASAGVHTMPNGSRSTSEGSRRLGPFTDSIRPPGGRITMMLGTERSYLTFPKGAVRTPREITIWIEQTVAPGGEEITVFDISPQDIEFFGAVFLTYRSSHSNGTMEFLSRDYQGNWLRAAVAAVQQSYLTFPIKKSGRYAIGERVEEETYSEVSTIEAPGQPAESLTVRPSNAAS